MVYTADVVVTTAKFYIRSHQGKCVWTGEVTSVKGPTCVIQWSNGHNSYPLDHSIENVLICLNDGTWGTA